MHAYTGDPIQVCGQFHLHARYKSNSATLPLNVLGGAGPSLLGRNWLSEFRLDWNEILHTHVVEGSVSTQVTEHLHAVIQTHPDLVKDELGTIKRISAKLEVKQGVSTKVLRARTVPYALGPPVEEEYNHLEQDGIIRKVEFSKWASPMVHVHELSQEQGCLTWGMRVVIPSSLRGPILEELHWSHPGVARMKLVAQSHVWWPKLDADHENLAHQYPQCITTWNAPPTAPLTPWTWPSIPWKRMDVNFATCDEKHYLIIVYAHSKWPEVVGPMRNTHAAATISALSNLLTRYSYPEQIVCDNGLPFQSSQYGDFLKARWRRACAHVSLPPHCQRAS